MKKIWFLIQNPLLFIFLLLCSCSHTAKIFEEQLITISPGDNTPITSFEKDPVAYQDYLSPMPIYEMQIVQKNPIEGIKVWDPLEKMNRGIFHFNDFVINWIINPVGTVYSFIVPEFAQKRISNVNDNISMPGKVVNNLLQLKLAETSSVITRFLLNSTIGIGGLFDFADYTDVSFLKSPPNQTFEKTFAHWGIPPGPYVVIPFLGPSDIRGGVGTIADLPLNVFTYYLPEVGYFLRANDIVYFLPLYYLATDSNDPYANLRDFSRLQMRGQIALEEHKEAETPEAIKPEDVGVLETLNFLKYSNNVNIDFILKADTGTIKFEKEESSISYSLWMQQEEAPLVVVLPGFGGSHDTELCAKVAEEFYAEKFSVLTTSSTFSEDFAKGFKNGKPGNVVQDTENIYAMIKGILAAIKKEYPNKITSVSLAGYSMGGFYTAFIAAKEEKIENPIFSSYISVHSPGNLTYALSTIDRYLFESYKDLNEEERTFRQLKSIGTIFEQVTGSGPNPWNEPFQIMGEDARFLIGFSYIRSLMVWVENHPIGSFSGYCRSLLVPAYQKKFNLKDEKEMINIFGYNNSYWKIQETLQNNSRLHLFINENDPLLDPQSQQLIKKIIPQERLHSSVNGGHLGNMEHLQKEVISILKKAKN